MFEVLNQPQDGSIGYVLEETLANNKTNGFENFYFLVAYAKRSGVGRLSPFLKKFRDSGGKITAVVGIDQKQTSFEALEELLSVSDDLFIFHNEIFIRTFHPKFYLFESPNNHVFISVGSSNLTGGGLYGNYEINSLHSFDLVAEENQTKFKSFMTTFNNYSDLGNECCKKVDVGLIQELLNEGYIFREEELRKKLISQKRNEIATERKSLFGKESFPEPPSRVISSKSDKGKEVDKVKSKDVGFWKKLSMFDVSSTSAPGQIIIPKGFIESFPPMDDPLITNSGGEQSDVFLNIIFEDKTGERFKVDNVRAIYYVPAPDHPRPNSELRFTFRNRDIFEMLSERDILEFKRSEEPAIWFVVRQIEPNNTEYNEISKGRNYDSI